MTVRTCGIHKISVGEQCAFVGFEEDALFLYVFYIAVLYAAGSVRAEVTEVYGGDDEQEDGGGND